MTEVGMKNVTSLDPCHPTAKMPVVRVYPEHVFTTGQ